MRWGLHRATPTFQRYCGILLAVTLDIQTVLLSHYGSEWVQDVTILVPITNIQDIGVQQEKAEPIKTLPFFKIPRASPLKTC